MRRVSTFIVLAVLLVSCGSRTADKPANQSGAETTISAQPDAVNQQLLAALTANDSAAVLALFDTNLTTRDLELQRLNRDWQKRGRPPEDAYRCPSSIGSFASAAAQPPVVNGATATVRTLLHHANGDAWLDVSLRQTSAGWRVFAWSSENICPASS